MTNHRKIFFITYILDFQVTFLNSLMTASGYWQQTLSNNFMLRIHDKKRFNSFFNKTAINLTINDLKTLNKKYSSTKNLRHIIY